MSDPTPTAENDAGCICPPDICIGTDSDSGMRVECAACLALDPELPCLRDVETDCGSNAADWCLAPNGVDCAKHDENGDRRA